MSRTRRLIRLAATIGHWTKVALATDIRWALVMAFLAGYHLGDGLWWVTLALAPATVLFLATAGADTERTAEERDKAVYALMATMSEANTYRAQRDRLLGRERIN